MSLEMSLTNKIFKSLVDDLIQFNMKDENLQKIVESIKNESIKSIILLYLFLNQLDISFFNCPFSSQSHQIAKEIKLKLDKEWISEAQDLCKLLTNHHFEAILIAFETIASKAYKPNFFNSNLAKDKILKNLNDSENDLRIKIVKVIKYHEPLGATVQEDGSTGNVFISRIIYGGAAHRSGMINIGDIIHEVNGHTLKGRSFPDIIELLEDECRSDTLSFKLIAGDYCDLKSHLIESKVRIKALFDYNPKQDDYHPCQEAGLSFRKGDILHIVSFDDPNWWQAKPELEQPIDGCFASYYRVGIIPSKKLQEKRFAELRDLKELYFINSVKKRYGYRYKMKRNLVNFRKVKKLMYRALESEDFEREDIQTYLEVDKLKPKKGQYRPLVLIELRSESSQIINKLVARAPTIFKTPILHTTRPSTKNEIDGCEFFFVEKEWFLDEIKNGRFIEYKQVDGEFYGIHAKSIEAIIQNGQTCLLNLSPRSIKLLYNPIFKPFVVFLKTVHNFRKFHTFPKFKTLQPSNSSSFGFQKEIDSKKLDILLFNLECLYGHYFDLVIVNKNEEDTIEKLINVVIRINTTDQWVPSSWTTSN